MKKLSLISVCLVLAMLLSTTGVFAESALPSDSYTHVDAQYEDSGITLWFDYATEKKAQDNTEVTDMESFTLFMAKNEIENAQFFLTADSAREGLSADITPFTSADGDVIDTELYIEYYHNCDDFGYLPDALPPLDAYVEKNGGFKLEAGKSQGFIIKLKTTLDSVAGDYSATLNIYDAEGKQIKTTTVFAHVWDFELSEATACATSVGLRVDDLKNQVTESGLAQSKLYKSYYDYMLENRICAYYLPVNPYIKTAVEYMDNPRVTSYQFATYAGGALTATQIKTMYGLFAGEENAHRLDKGYYFSNVVDVKTLAKLEEHKALHDAFAEAAAPYVPDYADKAFNSIATYIFDETFTVDGKTIDQIDYYDDFINHWCTKPFAYTREDELTTSGSKVLQPLKWNSTYGTFTERMAEKAEAGDKVWWFVSNDVNSPYINYYMQTDGVAQRVLFWQQYDNDVTGFLYNFVNFWMGMSDPYNEPLAYGHENQYGEWLLLYPGDDYGLGGTPVSGLRFEAMRDGIEDYQYFYMLEELKGDGAADSYIDLMTTGVTQYSTSDKDYYDARVALGEKIEAVVMGTDAGDSCEHEFVRGICTKCGEITEDIVAGDVDFDGSIKISDLFNIKRFINDGEYNEAELIAADLTGDGNLNISDLFAIKRMLA